MATDPTYVERITAVVLEWGTWFFELPVVKEFLAKVATMAAAAIVAYLVDLIIVAVADELATSYGACDTLDMRMDHFLAVLDHDGKKPPKGPREYTGATAAPSTGLVNKILDYIVNKMPEWVWATLGLFKQAGDWVADTMGNGWISWITRRVILPFAGVFVFYYYPMVSVGIIGVMALMCAYTCVRIVARRLTPLPNMKFKVEPPIDPESRLTGIAIERHPDAPLRAEMGKTANLAALSMRSYCSGVALVEYTHAIHNTVNVYRYHRYGGKSLHALRAENAMGEASRALRGVANFTSSLPSLVAQDETVDVDGMSYVLFRLQDAVLQLHAIRAQEIITGNDNVAASKTIDALMATVGYVEWRDPSEQDTLVRFRKGVAATTAYEPLLQERDWLVATTPGSRDRNDYFWFSPLVGIMAMVELDLKETKGLNPLPPWTTKQFCRGTGSDEDAPQELIDHYVSVLKPLLRASLGIIDAVALNRTCSFEYPGKPNGWAMKVTRIDVPMPPFRRPVPVPPFRPWQWPTSKDVVGIRLAFDTTNDNYMSPLLGIGTQFREYNNIWTQIGAADDDVKLANVKDEKRKLMHAVDHAMIIQGTQRVAEALALVYGFYVMHAPAVMPLIRDDMTQPHGFVASGSVPFLGPTHESAFTEPRMAHTHAYSQRNKEAKSHYRFAQGTAFGAWLGADDRRKATENAGAYPVVVFDPYACQCNTPEEKDEPGKKPLHITATAPAPVANV